MKRIIESNFIDLCIETSKITNSFYKTEGKWKIASNPFDPWFSRVYGMAENSSSVELDIDHIASKIRSGKYPNSLLITEFKDFERLRKVLESKYFNCFYTQAGMAMDLDSFECANIYKSESMRILNTMDELNDWIECIKSVFGSVKSIELYSKYLANKNFIFFAYYNENKIVGTTLLYLSEEIAGVHLVGTLENSRKQGIGSKLVKLAFSYAKEQGKKIGVLQASPIGKSMYNKIGFKDYSKITHWDLKI